MDGTDTATKFKRQLQVGLLGESLIARWFIKRGCIVMPAYEIEQDTKGPRVFTPGGTKVSPDLLVYSNETEHTFWVEAKHKSVFSWYRIKQQWETGIDLHHFRDYRELDSMLPWPVWLLFLHRNGKPRRDDAVHECCPPECPTGLFGEQLWKLANDYSHTSDKHGRSGMIYWGVDQLIRLATLDEIL